MTHPHPLLDRFRAGIANDHDWMMLADLAAAGRLVIHDPTPEAARRERLPERDALIREARARFHTALPITLAAKRLAADLASLDVIADPAKAKALAEILALSGGPLGWNRVYGILSFNTFDGD